MIRDDPSRPEIHERLLVWRGWNRVFGNVAPSDLPRFPLQPTSTLAATAGGAIQSREEPVNLRRSLARVEAGLAAAEREHVCILRPDGAEVYSGVGEADSVAVPAAVLRGNIVVHNHPGGGSLSRQDVQVLLEYQAAEVRVVTRAWTYSLQLPAETAWDDVEPLVTIIMDEVRERHRDLILAGQLTYEESEVRRWHDIWKTVAEMRGWAYHREARQRPRRS